MFSVVLNTFNRASLLPRAITAVLAQSLIDFEVIVVDDGSTDTTAEVVSSFDDERITYVHQVNAGLCAARNTGARHAHGRWLVFLDDDDEPLPWWLESFATDTSEETCGIVCRGVEIVMPTMTENVVPEKHSPLFGNQTLLFLPGAFSVRRDLFELSEGYAAELNCNHQTELGLRLVPLCKQRSLSIRSSDRTGLRMYREDSASRPLASPLVQYEGIPFILERHADLFREDPRSLSKYLSVAGVSAVRLGHYRDGRRFLMKAIRTTPKDWSTYARLALSWCPPLAKRVWKTDRYSPMPR